MKKEHFQPLNIYFNRRILQIFKCVKKNREELLGSISLKKMRTQVSSLIQIIKSTVKPVVSTQISENSKLKLIQLINEFETENNYSVKRVVFLEGIQSDAQRNLFKILIKYHHELGRFTLDLLNKGILFMSKSNKNQLSIDVQSDARRIMDYISSKLLNEYKRTLGIKLKKMRKSKELLSLKLDQANFHPQLSLLKLPQSSRVLVGIHDRKTGMEMKYGKFALVSNIQSKKERILSTIKTSLI